MEISKALRLLKEQIDKIESVKKTPAYNPQYKIWKHTTTNILNEAFSPEIVQMFEGLSRPHQIAVDPLRHLQNYFAMLDKQKELLEGLIQEHERFAGTGNAVVAGSKPIGTHQLHPEIAKVGGKLLDDGHFASAVEEAFKRVINEVKAHMDRKGEDLRDGGDSMIGHAFGIDNRLPPIKFNALASREDEDEQRGIMYLFKGVVGIRNKKAHANVNLDSPERAVEYLGLASLLMRLLDLSPKFNS